MPTLSSVASKSPAPPPVPLWQMFGLTLFAFLPVFFLLGPAVTALLGYAWQPRRGSGYVLWTGIVCMVWHMAFFAFMLAIQSWLPRALELFPGLAKYFHG